MPKARKAVNRYYQKRDLNVPLDRILLTASTSEAYSYLFRLLLNPDEGILVPRPSYPLFEFLAQLSDCEINYYPLIYKKNWQIDLEALKNAMTSKTRAIVIVNPNNPTGSFLKREELLEINRFCENKDIAIICDEVFLDYSFSGDAQEISLANNSEVLTFTLGGISKSLALPQMKVGWIVASGPKEIVEESLKRLEVISDTYLSVNTPSQNALSIWLSLEPLIQKEILKRLNENREYLIKNLSTQKNCRCLKNEGGWYTILRLPSSRSEDQWALEFLEKDHVFVHPGYFFNFDEEVYIVISLLPQPKIFREGLKRIFNRVENGLA